MHLLFTLAVSKEFAAPPQKNYNNTININHFLLSEN